MIPNTGHLAGRTIFITGASRGIGKAIALKAARDGANVVIAAKTAQPHPKLPGTIFTAAQEVEALGGKCLACEVDVRSEEQVEAAVNQAAQKFGGIDILVNNASAISLTHTLDTNMKRYDLMNSVNTRGTFLVSKACLPYLVKAPNPHILNISPPLNLDPLWFKNHVAYTIAKYGMSMCVLGMSEEFKKERIAVNALWPKTAIHTAAIEMLTGPESGNFSRKPEIMADAAYVIFNKDSSLFTGQFVIDEQILKEAGIEDFVPYAVNPENAHQLMPDFFLDAPSEEEKPEGGDKSEVENIFHAIQANILAKPDLVKLVNAVYVFSLHGDITGKWYIDLKHESGCTGKGTPVTPADASLSMSARDFREMFKGNLKPTTAFMTGKLKISGNLQKAMKLEKLMADLRAKM